MIETDLECFRGDTTEWDILVAKDGIPVDLTGATVVMTAKRGFAYPTPVFQRATGGLGIVIDPDQETNPGKCTVKLAPTSTSDLAADTTSLRYDVQVTTAGGDHLTVLYGVLTVNPDVTT